ncbi:hypothetical protein F5888DRAFT_1808365 [Russula emetica]|nr:hypothetical protein F5888DRAFT_1808365 [Russula emetica]
MRLSDLKASYPEFQEIYRNHFQGARFDTVFRRDGDFGARKLRLVSVQHLLGKHQRLRRKKHAKLVQSLLRGDFNSAQRILGEPKRPSIVFTLVATAVGACPPSPSNDETLKGEMKSLSARLSDSQFLLEMKDVNDEVLQPMIQEIQALSHSLLSPLIDTTVGAMARAVMELQQDVFRRNIQHDIERDEMKRRDEEFAGFVRKLNAQSAWRKDSVVRIYGLATTPLDDCGDSRGWISRSPYRSQEYWVTGRQETFKDYQLEFRVQLMSLLRDDKQNMQLDFNYIPNPIVNDRLSSHFHLPTAMNIAFCQILENERLLLILVDRERIFIYLELLLAIDPAIRRNRPIKSLNRESIGQDILFAYEETKRTLAVCSSRRLQLHVFVFDKTLKTLRAQGSAIDLSPWYSQARISILQVAFVSGKEEMVLVDSSSRACIFSFTSLQFRPASLSVPSLPNAIFSSPDGSCFLTLHNHDSKQSLTAYHWETFGSTHGIPLDVPEFSLQGAVITSMVSRGCIFLISLDVDTGLVRSIAIDITKKVTGFIFKKGGGCAPIKGERQTLHNSLLDCHTEVWTRFPVVPAVKRSTVTSLSEGHQKSLTFITEDHTRPFESYFTNLVQTFETTAKKPTEEELHSIQVSAAQFETFQDNVALNSDWDVSRYRAGEWLVDLLCLIPIHIAVCRENKFIPLADGVLSSDLERTLLGAEVNQIVDKLSFGWYESIFQSYLAAKPVKVVSSMGQQSVGKSFSLNHLLDTSFTGSAMRTTEGVWMSVTPTDEALIVSLDFEGVDSIKRSRQEDTIGSFTVLFRNNYAFTRDISGLFQSFQSSASVLDPAANPSLFQSTLVIIIKDVVNVDSAEIAKEFSLKFQRIVEQEQDANFISRLHGWKLKIIPWPVIESKGFYKSFSTLKKLLDSQKTSHTTASEFLHTIKTLMAKLKANDWGVLSQNMTEHRTSNLSALLPIALATGYSEVEPGIEPLKNFDTGLIVEGEDTTARFAIFQRERNLSAHVDSRLAALLESWNPSTKRQFMPDPDWTANLVSYINRLIDLRVNHVRLWLDSNLERFQSGHAAVEALRRQVDNMVIEMRSNVQLCRALSNHP